MGFFYYSLPINLLINAIRNPNLSNEVREYLLETAFCFLMKLFYDCMYMKSPPHSRIGLIRLINTVIGITVALENNQLVKLGSIGTHPLENFYGHLRITCNYDHSYKNIFTAVAKTVFIKKVLSNYDLDQMIRGRSGIGGTMATLEKTGGVIPDFSPFDLFRLVFLKMKDPSRDENKFVVDWYSKFKTIPWDERISIPSDVSGSNIVSRYLTGQNKKKGIQLKRQKIEKFQYVRSLERVYGTNETDEAACQSSSMLDFLHILYQPVNVDLSFENYTSDIESYS